MDYSDLVFEDLLKFPELSSKIFGKIKEESSDLMTKVEPKFESEKQNENFNIQESSVKQLQHAQEPSVEIKFDQTENIQDCNYQAAYYQQFPVILNSFSIPQTGLIFFVAENFNQQSQFMDSSTKFTPAPDENDSQKSSKPQNSSEVVLDQLGNCYNQPTKNNVVKVRKRKNSSIFTL